MFRIIGDLHCELAIVDEYFDVCNVKQLDVKSLKIYNPSVKVNITDRWKLYDRLAYIMYTSGTTGTPKGVMIKLANLENLIESFGEILYNNIVETVNVALLASLGFDSSVKQIYAALYYGHTLVIASEKEKRFSSLLQRFYSNNNIFISDGTPTNMQILLMPGKKISNRVKYFIIGGENLRGDIVERMYELHDHPINIYNVYGPTECCVDAAYYVLDSNRRYYDLIPIGGPLLNTELEIIDDHGNKITECGIKGELVILGKQVGAGYTNGNNDMFRFDSSMDKCSYRTGDIAIMNGEGQFLILGRKDNQVKRHGYRIELDEITVQIMKVDVVKDATVKKIDYLNDDRIVAFTVCSSDYNKDNLAEKLKTHMPEYMLPDYIIQIDSIPYNLNGKTDDRALRNIFYSTRK